MVNQIYSKQRGLTLTEMLIVLVLGLFIILAMMQILLSGKSSALFQQGMGQLQENARFALDAIARDVRRAGFPKSDPLVKAFITTGFTPVTADGGAGGASDTLVIQHQPSDGRDCLGQALPVGTTLTINAYYVSGGQLLCKGVGSGSAGVGATEGVVADFVDNMQILYGVDTTTTADGTAELYVTAGRVTTVGSWSRVVSVRIALLVNSGADVLQGGSPNTYSMLNVPIVGPFADRRARQVFNTTVLIRNQTPL